MEIRSRRRSRQGRGEDVVYRRRPRSLGEELFYKKREVVSNVK